MMLPTVMRGLSEPYGSWKIICTRRRIWRSSSPWSAARSLPSKKMLPAVAGCSWVTTRPRVDLPQPDSPTRPSVSPWMMSRVTPSTARTVWRPLGNVL